jgi:hypothetical protein
MTQRVHGEPCFLIYAAVREPRKMPLYAGYCAKALA